MSICFTKAITTLFLGIAPMLFAFIGPYALPIALVSWYGAHRTLLSLLKDVEKEERRAAGQAAHRSRVCVRRTRPYYSK